jgi:hypothetical protein
MVQGVAQINGLPSFLGCHTLGDRLGFVADLTICAGDGVSQIRQLVLLIKATWGAIAPGALPQTLTSPRASRGGKGLKPLVCVLVCG